MTVTKFDIEFLKNRKNVLKHVMVKCNYDDILADDIIQELYIRGKRAIQRGQYTEQGRFTGWLKYLASNLITDHWRREFRRSKFLNIDRETFDIMSTLTEPVNFEEEIIKQEEITRMMELVDLLPKEQSFVIKRIVIDGMAFNDLVNETGVGLNTLLGRKRYALINLRKVI